MNIQEKLLCCKSVLFKIKASLIIIFSILVYDTAFAQTSINKELNKTVNLDIDSIDFFLKSGDSLKQLKEYVKAEEYYNRAFNLSREKGGKKLIKKTGFYLANFLTSTMEKHEKAENVINYLNDFCTKIGDENCRILSLIRQGELKGRQFKFIKGLKSLNLALGRVEKTKNKRLHWQVLTSRGLLLNQIGDINQGRKDFKNSLQYETSNNTKSFSYINISSSFPESQPDSTIYYSRLAASYCLKDSISRNCMLTYNNIAWAYFLKGKPQMALDIIQENINLKNVEYRNSDTLLSALMHTLGVIHYDLKNYDKAIYYLKLSQESSARNKDVSGLLRIKEDLSLAYEKKGYLKSSITILREIKPLIEKLDSLKVNKEIARIESKKLLEVKEAEISSLEQENFKIENKINKTRLFSVSLASFLSLGIFILLYRGHKNKIRFHQLNEELSLNRLRSLRSMMNPHFLFNSFSTLQNYILKKENLKANEYMTELSGLIRNVLTSSDSIYTTFNKELQILKSYIKIEKDRFSGAFEVVYNVDQKLIKADPTIPSMVVQPYIENAIIHGFSNSKKNRKLMLSFHIKGETVVCTVLDNGIGREEAEKIKRKGKDTMHLSIATRNTKERLKILSKLDNRSASITINDLFEKNGVAKGTEVVMILPIHKQNKTND